MAKTINEQKTAEVELLQTGTPVKDTVNLPIDASKPDLTWSKYGTITYPVNLQNKYGKIFDTGELKAITQNSYLTAVVSRKYMVIVHEPIDEMVNEFVNDPKNGIRLLTDPKTTYHGRNKFWLLIDDKHSFKLQGSHIPNDDIKFGVAIRNSIGGRLAFGCDLFSFRSICQNGAIFGYKNFGGFSRRHFGSGDVTAIANELFSTLRDQLGRASEIINYYQRFASKQIENNFQLFEDLAKQIPLKYFPEWVKIIHQNKAKGTKRRFIIKPEYRTKTYWEIFNDLSQNIWHEKDLSFDAIRHQTKSLHEIVIKHTSK